MRSGKDASAAQAASDGSAITARDPNRRQSLSKPGPARWTPGYDLAPGLYLVATPIGNLGDIGARALWVLREVDRILCEDTRVTAKLLAHYGIDRPLEPYHDHNADRVRPQVLAALRRGERLALVSDAGTPLVSDPGFKLVREAAAENLPVTAAPGPSAAIAALILSGLPPEPFLFAGFLPPRSSARRKKLAAWRGLDATLLLFEGPSRLAACLADIAEMLGGGRPVAVARELTKRHEEVRRDTAAALAAHYREAGPPRGEVVIVIGPPAPEPPAAADIDARLAALMTRMSVRDAAAALAGETGLGRSDAYRRALALRPRR